MKCQHDDCTRDADTTVTYRDPEEHVAYCADHATQHFGSDPKAIHAVQGIKDDGDDDD